MHLPDVLFGTLRDHYILLFSAAGLFALGIGFVGAWLGAHFGARSALRRGVADADRTLARQEDLRLLGDELQTLMLEVERMSEGQRFVAKLLAERSDPSALPSAVRSHRDSGTITPH